MIGRRKRGTHNPIHMNGMTVKCVSSFKFLGTYIMPWTTNICSLVKEAHQWLVLVSEDAEEEPPELLPLCDWECPKKIYHGQVWKLLSLWTQGTTARDENYKCIKGTPFTIIDDINKTFWLHRAGSNPTRILSHWMGLLTIFTSNKPTSILSRVHSFKMKGNQYRSHIKTDNNTWPEESRPSISWWPQNVKRFWFIKSGPSTAQFLGHYSFQLYSPYIDVGPR